jgi:hypothetical protein
MAIADSRPSMMLNLTLDLVKWSERVPGRSGERAEMNGSYSIPYLPNWGQIQNLPVRSWTLMSSLLNEVLVMPRLDAWSKSR